MQLSDMNKLLIPALLAVFSLQVSAQVHKAPSYPLITHTTYFSVWSPSDTLNASPTQHWTGADQPLRGYAKVDGTTYSFMGVPSKQYRTIVAAGDEQPYAVSYTEND